MRALAVFFSLDRVFLGDMKRRTREQCDYTWDGLKGTIPRVLKSTEQMVQDAAIRQDWMVGKFLLCMVSPVRSAGKTLPDVGPTYYLRSTNEPIGKSNGLLVTRLAG
jgi:hypothetical protein